MDNTISWLEDKFVPILGRISTNKHMVIFKDTFASFTPIILVGSFAALVSIFLSNPTFSGATYSNDFFSFLVNINRLVWRYSTDFIAPVIALAFGYKVAEAYEENPIGGSVISLISFLLLFVSIDNSYNIDFLSANSLRGDNFFGVQGYFSAIIVGYLSSLLFVKLSILKDQFKDVPSVPPAVPRTFYGLIPWLITPYIVLTVSLIANSLLDISLLSFFYQFLQIPLMFIFLNPLMIVAVALLIHISWFFGMHGHNVMAPVFSAFYLPALIANMSHMANGFDLSLTPFIWNGSSFDAFMQMGGSGVGLSLLIALIIFSRNEDKNNLAKDSFKMGLFNINEPMLFGLPIVSNRKLFIPFLLTPVISFFLAYTATAAGIIPPVIVALPWVTPPVLYAFLATGGSVSAALFSIFNIVVSVIIYMPFVKSLDKENAE